MQALPDSLHTVLELAHQKGVLRARDLNEIGVPRTALAALCARGSLQRVERGTYLLADADVSAHQTLVEVAQRVPNGVICLLSALAFHEIGTQLPSAVWLCIASGTKAPRFDYPMMEAEFSRATSCGTSPSLTA